MRLRKKVLNLQKGFSLVELLIYMGILSMLVMVLSMLLASVLDVQLDSTSSSVVDQDSRYIQARMAYDMQRASSIDGPAAGATSNTSMQITVNGTTYTYDVSGGNLRLNDGSGTYNLNSSDTTISGVSFQHLGSGTSNDTVRINYTVTSRIQEHSGTESRTIQTALGLP